MCAENSALYKTGRGGEHGLTPSKQPAEESLFLFAFEFPNQSQQIRLRRQWRAFKCSPGIFDAQPLGGFPAVFVLEDLICLAHNGRTRGEVMCVCGDEVYPILVQKIESKRLSSATEASRQR